MKLKPRKITPRAKGKTIPATLGQVLSLMGYRSLAEAEHALRVVEGVKAQEPTIHLSPDDGDGLLAYDASTGKELGPMGVLEQVELKGGARLHTHLIIGHSRDDEIYPVQDAAGILAKASKLDEQGVLDKLKDDVAKSAVTFFGRSDKGGWSKGLHRAHIVRAGDKGYMGRNGTARNPDGSFTLMIDDFDWINMGVTVRDVVALWSRRGVDVSGFADKLGIKVMPLPDEMGDIAPLLKKGDLVDQLKRFWPSITSDLSNATRNGLGQCKEPGRPMWRTLDCITWAQGEGKWKSPAAARSPGLGWIPRGPS